MKGRRVVIAAAAVVVAAVAILVMETRHQTRPGVRLATAPASDLVPWKDRPLSPDVATTTSTTSALPRCKASELETSPSPGPGSATGTTYWRTPITNRGAACELSGVPGPTSARNRTGTRVTLPQSGGEHLGSVELAPGARASVMIAATDLCRGNGSVSPSVDYTDVVVQFDGRAIALPGVTLTLCPDPGDESIIVSFASDQPPADPPPPPAGSVGTLVATYERPPSPQPGTVVSYVVVLSNPTMTDVHLDPCPAYQEGAYPSILTYRLNCDAVTTIRAGGQARYEMKAQLAPNALVDKFFWRLVPDGPYAKR